MSFHGTPGFDHLLIVGLDGDAGHSFSIDKNALLRKPATRDNGPPDFISLLDKPRRDPSKPGHARSAGAGASVPSRSAAAIADFSSFVADLGSSFEADIEALMYADGFDGAGIAGDEDMALAAEELHIAQEHDDEDLNIDAAEPSDLVAAEEDPSAALATLGMQELAGWRISDVGGELAGVLAWMVANETLSVVCKRKSHACKGHECKMMIRVPVARRGTVTWAQQLVAAYRWLARGRVLSRDGHLEEADTVKRSFGMKPRAKHG